MIATWVMIMMFSTWNISDANNFSGFTTAEFYDREACEAAVKSFLEEMPDKVRSHRLNKYAFCVAKGSTPDPKQGSEQ